MSTTREQAYDALYAKLQAVPGVATCTRRLRHWNDVPPEQQPAVYLQVGSESRSNAGRRLPPRVELTANVYLYVQTEEGEAGRVLNPMLDALDSAIAVPPGNDTQTLGGVVHHCWIDGTTQIFEGDLGSQAVAIVPINMLITPFER